MEMKKGKKITVLGAGNVGASIAYITCGFQQYTVNAFPCQFGKKARPNDSTANNGYFKFLHIPPLIFYNYILKFIKIIVK